jgi:hypothetical protein
MHAQRAAIAGTPRIGLSWMTNMAAVSDACIGNRLSFVYAGSGRNSSSVFMVPVVSLWGMWQTGG